MAQIEAWEAACPYCGAPLTFETPREWTGAIDCGHCGERVAIERGELVKMPHRDHSAQARCISCGRDERDGR